MIVDGRTVPAGTTLASDVCIVGSGPAGLSLALRLSRTPRLRVHVLEAGGVGFNALAQEQAGGDTVGPNYFPLHEARIRALGGSSMSWAGVCAPLECISFSDRPWVSADGWPFSQATLRPYLDDALSFCQIGPVAARDAEATAATLTRQLGNDASQVEVTPINFSPTRFGSAYRQEIASAQSLTVYLHSTATELELADSGSHIQSVRVRCLGGGEFRMVAPYYVLAAGGIENPRLLLASVRVRERGIANEHGLVGTHFMEHPRVRNRYRVRTGDTPLGRLISTGTRADQLFMRMSVAAQVQRNEELLASHANLNDGFTAQLTPQWEAVRRIVYTFRQPAPFFHGFGGGRARIRRRDLVTVLRRPDRSLASAVGRLGRPASMRQFLQVFSSVEQVPNPRNRVELVRERDALGVPKVRVHWSISDAETRTYRRSLEILLGVLERLEPGIRSASIEPHDPWPGSVIGTWHHMGTTRMHADPRRGVVDADCRVHGVENLFVAGSSVFPTAGSAAPTLAIIQLAFRLGDHLSGLLC